MIATTHNLLGGLTGDYQVARDSVRPALPSDVSLGIADGLTWDNGLVSGATLVTEAGTGSWCVSTIIDSAWSIQLHVYRVLEAPARWQGRRSSSYQLQPHPALDGLRFSSAEQANRAAYQAGVLFFHYYRLQVAH